MGAVKMTTGPGGGQVYFLGIIAIDIVPTLYMFFYPIRVSKWGQYKVDALGLFIYFNVHDSVF